MGLDNATFADLLAFLVAMNVIVCDALRMTSEQADEFMNKDGMMFIWNIAERKPSDEGYITSLVDLLNGDIEELGAVATSIRKQLIIEVFTDYTCDCSQIFPGLSYLRKYVMNGKSALEAVYKEKIINCQFFNEQMRQHNIMAAPETLKEVRECIDYLQRQIERSTDARELAQMRCDLAFEQRTAKNLEKFIGANTME